MPAISQAQGNLMRAAEHGATFPMAKKLRSTMSHSQLHDFATTKTKGLPRHVPKKKKVLSHGATTLGAMYRGPQ